MNKKGNEIIKRKAFLYNAWQVKKNEMSLRAFSKSVAHLPNMPERSTIYRHIKYAEEVLNGERKDKELKELLIGKSYCLIDGEIFECLKSVTIDDETFVLYLDDGIEKKAQVDEHMVGSIEEIKDKYISWISKLFYKFRGKKAKEQFNKLNNGTF